MPCASRIGSSPCCARTPVTSASEKARCAGMLNKAGRVRSPMGQHRLHHWNGLRRADVEPQPLMRYAIETPSRSEEHTSELQSLMRISYAVFCLTKKNHTIR